MTLQYDENGIVIQTLSEIITEREDELKSTFGSDLELTGDTVIGNIQVSDADRELDIQQLLAFLVSQMSVSNSSGIFLDWNAQFKNQIRLSPLKTQITRTITGTPSATIAANDLVITNDNNGYDFVLSANATISTGGTVQGTFESLGYEDVTVNDGDTFTIATPLADVTSVTFVSGDSKTQTGRGSEIDSEFRNRVLTSDLAGSLGLSQAIVDKIKLLDGVTGATYIENKSSTDWTYESDDTTAGTGAITTAVNSFNVAGAGTSFLTELDANYRLEYEDEDSDDKTLIVSTIPSATLLNPTLKTTSIATGVSFTYTPPRLPPNSFEIIVLGGTDEDIAETILNNKVPTTQTIGTTTINVTDDEGQVVTINFTRPAETSITITGDVTPQTGETITGTEQDALKQEFVDYWDELKQLDINNGVGLDVDADDFAQLSNTNEKIKKIRNLLVNGVDYLEINRREIATLIVGNVNLTFL